MSVFVLKIIACVAMLIDHFGAAIMLPTFDQPWFNAEVYELTRGIGRIAFPIFAYLIAQGCVHTKNIGKYLLRLGLLAIISEPFFDMAFRFWEDGINFFADTNIFYTLFLGVAGIVIYEKTRPLLGDIIGFLAATPVLAVAWLMNTDYAHIGVGLILLVYIMRPENPLGRCIALTIGMTVLYIDSLYHLLFSLVAVGLIALYNGKPGPNNAAVKWGFYFFYPAHIAALVASRSIFFQS